MNILDEERRAVAGHKAKPNMFHPCLICCSAVPYTHTLTCSEIGECILPEHQGTQLWDIRAIIVQPNETAEAAARQLRKIRRGLTIKEA